MLNIKLPHTYSDTKEIIETVLRKNRLLIKGFDSVFNTVSDIRIYNVEPVNFGDLIADDFEDGYSNCKLNLVYDVKTFIEDSPAIIEVSKSLMVLNTMNDTIWTYRMIQNIWEGDYPSTVAIDMETREVFLFNLKPNWLELVRFGILDELQFEAITLGLNFRSPFYIGIDTKAMYQYIDGAEGLNYLKKNIIIEFDCGIPITLRCDI
jgi:hypothetical protein